MLRRGRLSAGEEERRPWLDGVVLCFLVDV